jgi:ABC-type polysaccharide/polyol phosphate export permease
MITAPESDPGASEGSGDPALASDHRPAPSRPHGKVTVYEPTITGLPPLREYLVELWRRRPFMWHLARTELKARHYDTVIGQVWIILDPLLLAAVYYMLRTVVRPPGGAGERNMVIAHLITGVMFFQYTSHSLTDGARSIIGNQQLILNTSFPRAVFPLVSVVEAFVDFAPTLIILMLVHAVLGQPWGWPILFLPLIIALLTVFNLGLSLVFGPITVFFRDTTSFLPYASQIWLYATPVLYTVAEIPPNLLTVLQWNPLFPFFVLLEQIFGGLPPDPTMLLECVAWAFGLFFVGAFVFLAKEREFSVRF